MTKYEYGETTCLSCGYVWKTDFMGMPKGYKGTCKDCIRCKVRKPNYPFRK